MGGFQKYPIPRFLHVQAWTVNRNWRKNVFHAIFPLSLWGFLMYRNLSLSTVNLLRFINNYYFQYSSRPEGYYLDPEDYQAPKLLKL